MLGCDSPAVAAPLLLFAASIVVRQGECLPSVMVSSLTAFHELLVQQFKLAPSSSNNGSS